MTNSRKRGQNEGSIYQRKDGRWAGAVSLGYGKRKTVYGRTAEETREKLDQIKSNLKLGITLAPERTTVAEVCGLWLDAKRETVRPKTYESYSGLLRKHVLPNIGRLRLSNLTPGQLERFYVERLAIVSPKTTRNLHIVLRQMLDWAVRRDLVARNPARLVSKDELPRVPKYQVTVFSPQQARDLIDASKGTESEALITLAISIGARVGELIGISWDKFTFSEDSYGNVTGGRVRIDRALQYVDGEPRFFDPKTEAGRRTIELPTVSIPSLLRQREKQREDAKRARKGWRNEFNLVFTTETGHPLNRNMVLRRYLRPLLAKSDLPERTRFHDLRHACASLLLAQGTPIPVVSKMLGHANSSVTMSVYSHALPNSQTVAATNMDKLLRGDSNLDSRRVGTRQHEISLESLVMN